MELKDIRKEIEDIDYRILELSKRRLELAKMVGAEKVKDNSPVRNIEVENKVIDRYRGFAVENGMNPDCAETICMTLMQESIEAQAALSHESASLKHIAIIGGNGKMGHWFSELLTRSGHTVDVIDPSLNNGLTIDDCSKADIVIVSIPISHIGDILKKLDTICKESTLIFDIASLKSPFIDTLRELGSRRKVCSIHPMFGPSAGSMYNRNLLICNCGNDDAVSEAVMLLENHGANMHTMNVEEHDVYMSYVLGLSHAVNIAFFTVLERSGISFDDMRSVASTTYSKLMDTNVSVALEDPYLYYEIQHLNASRDRMLNEFNRSVGDVVKAAQSDDPSAFKELMDKGRIYFTEKD